MAISTLQYRIDGLRRRIEVTQWLVQQDSRGRWATSALLEAVVKWSNETGHAPNRIEPYWLEFAGPSVTDKMLVNWVEQAAKDCGLTVSAQEA